MISAVRRFANRGRILSPARAKRNEPWHVGLSTSPIEEQSGSMHGYNSRHAQRRRHVAKLAHRVTVGKRFTTPERWRRGTSPIHILAKGLKRYPPAKGIANIKGTMASTVGCFANGRGILSPAGAKRNGAAQRWVNVTKKMSKEPYTAPDAHREVIGGNWHFRL